MSRGREPVDASATFNRWIVIERLRASELVVWHTGETMGRGKLG